MAAESPKKQSQFKPNQTQSPKDQNERKLICHKGLQKKRRFRSPKKQTQSNPIEANSPAPKAKQSQLKPIKYQNKPKTNPIKPNTNPIKANTNPIKANFKRGSGLLLFLCCSPFSPLYRPGRLYHL